MLQKSGLEDASLAHEDEHRMVHDMIGKPTCRHGHQPLLEGIHEVFLTVIVTFIVLHMHHIGKLGDIIGVLTLFPGEVEVLQVTLQRIVVGAEIAVDDGMEHLLTDAQAIEVHLVVDGIL